MLSGREAYHEIRRRKALRLYPRDRLFHRLAEGRHHAGAPQDVEPLFRREPADRLLDLERLRHVRVQLLRHRNVDARGKQQSHRIDSSVLVNHRNSPSTLFLPMPPGVPTRLQKANCRCVISQAWIRFKLSRAKEGRRRRKSKSGNPIRWRARRRPASCRGRRTPRPA